MSTKKTLGNEVSRASDDEQLDETIAAALVDEVAEREANLRPTVELEIQAKVDTNHPDARPEGLTLEAEERLEAREWEIERTHARFDRRQDSDREARTRRVVERGSVERRTTFQRRAGSVDLWADPDQADPRERLSRADLGEVNREAARLADELDGWSRAAISRLLAEKRCEGMTVMDAVFAVYDELRKGPGQVIPIDDVVSVPRGR